MVNEISSLWLNSCQVIIEAEDSDLSLSCFSYLTRLTQLSSAYKNNLLIDSIIHLLVEATHLSIKYYSYAAQIPITEPQPSSINLSFIYEPTIESILPASPSTQQTCLYIDYNPLLQIIHFSSTISQKAYSTLLSILSSYASSIQKGYYDLVFFSYLLFYLVTINLLSLFLWYYFIIKCNSYSFIISFQ